MGGRSAGLREEKGLSPSAHRVVTNEVKKSALGSCQMHCVHTFQVQSTGYVFPTTDALGATPLSSIEDYIMMTHC